jgi:cytoskeletal protein RodZ
MFSGGAAWAASNAGELPGDAHHAKSAEVDDSTTTSSDSTTSTSESTSTTSSTSTTTTTMHLDAPKPGAPPASSATCNHGADVSRVAHEAPRGHGNEHGKAVSAAAHLKCDKNKAGDDAGESNESGGAGETHGPPNKAPKHKDNGHHDKVDDGS